MPEVGPCFRRLASRGGPARRDQEKERNGGGRKEDCVGSGIREMICLGRLWICAGGYQKGGGRGELQLDDIQFKWLDSEQERPLQIEAR